MSLIPFIINITNDDIIEYNEKLIITIESVSTCGVTIGNVSRSEVIIIDDDSE